MGVNELNKKTCLLSIFFYCVFSLLFPIISNALTADEAIQLAIENLPEYRASVLKIKSMEALYDASLSPYLPELDSFFTKSRRYTQSTDDESKSYGLTLSYLLFDGGRRFANRDITRLNLENERESLRDSLLDLRFKVKSAFYRTLAIKETIQQRKIQLEDAQKDFDVAEGRYKLGVARLLDVLQASVRLEQARYNLIQAEGDYNKALSELNSLIGLPVDEKRDLKGTLDLELNLPDRAKVLDKALNRPDVIKAGNLVKILENNKKLITSEFYPLISASASYTKTDGGVNTISREDKVIALTASWNVFEWGKFFRRKSAEIEESVAVEKYNEIKRVAQLETYKAYEDIITALNKLKVAKKQLELAEHNYKQAFGEYKVGKGDMLTLIQAESALANAREQTINSKLSVILSVVALERIVGIENLSTLK